MRLSAAFALLLALWARAASAQTAVTGDLWIAGSLAVGTTVQGARLEVRATSTTVTPFSVFSQASASDPFPALQVDNTGRLGSGVAASTWSRVDTWGVGDVGDIGMQLWFGNLYPTLSGATQIAFSENGTSNYRHAIDSVHLSSTARNSIDLWLWTPSGGASAASMPNLHVLSVVTTSSSSVAGAQVMPNDTEPNALDAQLEISNGSVTGGGTLHRWAEATHSSRALKTDIRYLDAGAESAALANVEALRHARFRYMVRKHGKLVRDKRQPIVRGVIWEDTPQSIRGPGQMVVIQERVSNLELGMKELMRQVDALQAETDKLK